MISAPIDLWSSAYQPTRSRPDYYEVIYSIDKCEFKRRDGNIETRCEVTVCPESNMELRLGKLTNIGRKEATLELTSLRRSGADGICGRSFASCVS